MALSTNQVAQLSSAIATAVTQALSQQQAEAGAGTGATTNNGRSECTSSSGGLSINRTTISTSILNNRWAYIGVCYCKYYRAEVFTIGTAAPRLAMSSSSQGRRQRG